MRHYRKLLEDREGSIARELKIIGSYRETQESQLAEQLSEFQQQEKEWEQRREVEQADNKRQQNMLALHADNLETRRHRLDQLQRELEESHRQTLEMKVAVEERWQELQAEDDSEDLSGIIDRARQELSIAYKQQREETRNLREQLTQQRANLEMQTQLFQEEKQSFREWIAERETALAGRHTRLQEIEHGHDEREQAWRDLRDRWLKERIEAEELIRNLLSQLTELKDPLLVTQRGFQAVEHATERRFPLWQHGGSRMTGLPARPLGNTGLDVSAIGFGSFKIGRNQGIKYPTVYDLPSDDECAQLLDGILSLGINLIDTAPAYGEAEARLGKHLSSRREEIILSSKMGERFVDGVSHYQFGSNAVRDSVEASLRRLKTDHLDLLLIHSDGNDLHILQETDTVDALLDLKQQGKTRAIGLSGKTVEGATDALAWADVLMVEFHLQDTSHLDIMKEAHEQGVGVLIKKGLAAGHLDPREAIRFVLSEPSVDSLVLGGLNLEHFRANCEVATEVRVGRSDNV